MKKLLATIAITGLISGYASTVLQLTNGPKNLIRDRRDDFVGKHTEHHFMPPDDEVEETDGTWAELATCPWWLAPYVTAPIWGMTAALTGVKGWRSHLLGYAASVALGAFMRHQADRY